MSYSHSAEEATESEEKARAKWKLRGSHEGISEFRSRLQARRENTILFINLILLVTLVIIVWEITKKFIKQNSEKQQPENAGLQN